MKDDALFDRYFKGNAENFDAVALHYYDYIYAICLKITKNEQDSLDAAQEALVRIYMNLCKFEEKSKLSTWIYAISRNAALDILRQKKKFDSSMKYMENTHKLDGIGTKYDDFSIYELRIELIRLINLLPKHHRAVIILRDIEGRTYREASTILDINICTMKSRLSRARKKLREGILPYLEIQ